ncbi:spore coat protein [Desmospora activa]|uniref:spore coat protein n=1 Tax=Desmospora activa TaxID=500615 RepID=UPI000D31DD9E
MSDHRHLAWHETMELHELTAFQASALIKLKKSVRKVKDPQLQSLYIYSIQLLEQNLRELLLFYSYAPSVSNDHHCHRGITASQAGDLLGLAKTSVRTYAAAITETATPILRRVLTKQLHAAVEWHGKIFYYMLQHGYYPAYNLEMLLRNDQVNAQRAIAMRY